MILRKTRRSPSFSQPIPSCTPTPAIGSTKRATAAATARRRYRTECGRGRIRGARSNRALRSQRRRHACQGQKDRGTGERNPAGPPAHLQGQRHQDCQGRHLQGAQIGPRVKDTEDPLPFTRGQREKSGLSDSVWKELRADCRLFARKVLQVEGDKWQDMFWGALSGPHIDPTAKRQLALKACKGPGKTFAEGVGGWWWMFTRWHARGVAMSITADNLRDNLWTEFAHLQQRSPLLSQFFSHKGERIECKEYPKDWWLSARSFPQNADKTQQANTLAGLHGRHPIVLCDEAGDYPDGVVVAAEAILASLVDGKPPDGRIIIAGNPTSTEGPLYRVTKKDRSRWWVYEITSDPRDPNRTPRVDQAWVNEQIDAWGYDSDFVKNEYPGPVPQPAGQQAHRPGPGAGSFHAQDR